MDRTVEQNAQHIMEALDHFGFASLGLKAQDFLVPDQIIQLGNPAGIFGNFSGWVSNFVSWQI